MASHGPDNVRAALWALFAVALFSTGTVLAKVAVTEFHVLQILFFRQVVVFLSCLPIIARSFPESLKTSYPSLHVIRLIGAFIALSCSIWAVAVLPLTTAVTLGFSQVIFIALLSMKLLGERVGKHRLIAVMLGFSGVVLAMRPGVDGFLNPYMLIPVVGALGAAVAVIAVRKLSQTESTQTLLVYQSVFVGVLAAIPLVLLWKTPDPMWLCLLLVMGVLAAGGQWAGVKALRLGEASVVGPVKYMELVFAAILGYLLFSEVPSSYTIAGAVIIITSSLYIMQREAARRAARSV